MIKTKIRCATKILKNQGVLFLKTIIVNLGVNYCQFEDYFCYCSNEMQLRRIWRAKQKNVFSMREVRLEVGEVG